MNRWLALYVTLQMIILTGCAYTKPGGMTPQDAFYSYETAEFVESVLSNNFSVADKHLSKGAKINEIGKNDISPLLYVLSAKSWDKNRIEYLLKNGADPNYKAKKNSLSAMYSAAGGDKPWALKLMLSYHGDPNLMGGDGFGSTDLTVTNPQFKIWEYPMISVAAQQSRVENIKILLDGGANINALDTNGNNVAFNASYFDRYDIIYYLLERGLTAKLDQITWVCTNKPSPVDPKMRYWKNMVMEKINTMSAKDK